VKADLIARLRTEARLALEWPVGDNAPFVDWSDLMDEAADALQEAADDEPYNEDTLRQAAIELRAWADSRECVLMGRENLSEQLADELDRVTPKDKDNEQAERDEAEAAETWQRHWDNHA